MIFFTTYSDNGSAGRKQCAPNDGMARSLFFFMVAVGIRNRGFAPAEGRWAAPSPPNSTPSWAHSLLRPRAQCAISNGRRTIGKAFMLIFHGCVGVETTSHSRPPLAHRRRKRLHELISHLIIVHQRRVTLTNTCFDCTQRPSARIE